MGLWELMMHISVIGWYRVKTGVPSTEANFIFDSMAINVGFRVNECLDHFVVSVLHASTWYG